MLKLPFLILNFIRTMLVNTSPGEVQTYLYHLRFLLEICIYCFIVEEKYPLRFFSVFEYLRTYARTYVICSVTVCTQARHKIPSLSKTLLSFPKCCVDIDISHSYLND